MAILKMATAKTEDFSLVDFVRSDGESGLGIGYEYIREISSEQYRSSLLGVPGYSYKFRGTI